MPPKKFGNQSVEQIIKHLEKLLDPELSYSLHVDPMGINYSIKECVGGRKNSEKREIIRSAQQNMSKGQKKKMSTRRLNKPKIRSVKKGRTVNLKGREY